MEKVSFGCYLSFSFVQNVFLSILKTDKFVGLLYLIFLALLCTILCFSLNFPFSSIYSSRKGVLCFYDCQHCSILFKHSSSANTHIFRDAFWYWLLFSVSFSLRCVYIFPLFCFFVWTFTWFSFYIQLVFYLHKQKP